MAAKPVQFQDLATLDVNATVDFYVSEAGAEVALRFVDAVEATVRRVAKSPGLGSLRFAYELSIPGLRATTVGRFPYLMFYVEGADSVDVWRLLHSSRDIPTTLQESDS